MTADLLALVKVAKDRLRVVIQERDAARAALAEAVRLLDRVADKEFDHIHPDHRGCSIRVNPLGACNCGVHDLERDVGAFLAAHPPAARETGAGTEAKL